MKAKLTELWAWVVKWRTAIVGWLFAAAAALPPVLNAPEVLAIVPAEYRPYVIAGAFLLMWLTRPRAAVLPDSLEASVSRVRKAGAR
jgi:hypothetical protein